MESYVEKLDQLISLKKVKGHKISKSESDEYYQALSELLQEDKAFSERAEQYLYEGLTFTGAAPFVDWVIASEDKHSAIMTLFKGKCYGKDTASTFRVLVSALAKILKTDIAEKEIICPIIERIPYASKNKEKKIIGDGHRVILKYFINEIDSKTKLPDLAALGLNQAFIRSFVEVFDELLCRLEEPKLSSKEVRTIASIRLWLHLDVPNKDTYPNSPESTRHGVVNNGDKPERAVADNPCEELETALDKVSDIARRICQNVEGQKSVLLNQISAIQKEKDSLNSQLELSRQREKNLTEQISEKQDSIVRVNAQLRMIEKERDELAQSLNEKNQEIQERSQMMEALSRDRAKQSDELVHRISAKLKVEYKDFKDAETLPMNSDLGENMREQLKNVFMILSKEGISLE